jgi:hypothetical protein
MDRPISSCTRKKWQVELAELSPTIRSLVAARGGAQ